jgi:uncharacterized protein YbaP (TraB family)
MSMRPIPFLLAAAMALAPTARAQTATAPSPSPAPEPLGAVLDTAVVRAPGPGMWKVRRGDNTLWILGRVSPLPANMLWNSARLRSVVASADAVIGEPSVVVGADIGFFGKLALLPSLVGVRDLPDDAHLRDVLPPASHARWLRLKQRYLGSNSKVEQWRPIFAASELYEQALKTRGLSRKNVVSAALGEAMKARGLKQVPATAKLTIAEPKKALREFKGAQLADVRCFDRMLDRVENDLDTLAARADAWAAGDVATLRRLQSTSARDDCEDALLSGAFAQKYGLDKLQAQARARWIAEAEASLSRNRSALSVLPMDEVLAADGVVAALAAKGYLVEAPDAPAVTTGAEPVATAH